MDTSESYIKMCEQAKEIQAICNYNRYDYFGVRNSKHTFRWDINNKPRDEYIWLPRQDQLQEMAEPISKDELIRRFFEWYHHWFMSQDAPTACHTSMEQLWLAFVMKEKYNKIWSNGDWIKK